MRLFRRQPVDQKPPIEEIAEVREMMLEVSRSLRDGSALGRHAEMREELLRLGYQLEQLLVILPHSKGEGWAYLLEIGPGDLLTFGGYARPRGATEFRTAPGIHWPFETESYSVQQALMLAGQLRSEGF